MPVIDLQQRFINHIKRNWYSRHSDSQNYKPISSKSGVYIFVSLDFFKGVWEIVYIGSSTNLFARYKNHCIPDLIQGKGLIPIHFFIEMEKGFYDYELKLIKKFKPIFNKNTYGG